MAEETAEQTAEKAVDTRTDVEKWVDQRKQMAEQLATAAITVEEASAAIADLKESKGKKYKESIAYPLLNTALETAVQTVARLEPRVAGLDKKLASEQFVGPLIKAFGAIEMDPDHSAHLPKRVALTEVDEQIEKLGAKFAPINATIAALQTLGAAVVTAGIDHAAADAMRAVTFVRGENGTVTIAVAQNRGGSGGKRKVYRITAVGPDAPEGVKALVGSTIGTTDMDLPSFKLFAETYASAEDLDKLTGLTETGKPKSRSAREFCEATFGMVLEEIDPDSVTPDATPAS